MADQSASSVGPSPQPPGHSAAGSSPAWVLLDRQARVAYRRNGTTARAVSSRRLDIEVSFCFAEPPRLSRCCIYSPPGPARAEFVRGSCVVCSAGGIAVLRLEIGGGGVSSEYYLYRANPERPSLRLLTLPAASWELFHANDTNLCILPCAGGDEGGIVLATLYLVTDPHADHLHKAGHLHLQIFSSESWDWNTKLVVLDPSVPQGEELFYFANNFAANKVISLGEGLLGWVDLLKGILFCDAFEENPTLRFIRLPTKMRNSNTNYSSRWSARAEWDVTFCNGLIKLVEVETASDFCDKVTPFDSDLELGDNVHTCHVGWRATTWSRMISWKYWQKDRIVTDDDISVDNRHADLLAELRDNYSREITLKNLLVGAPKLSIVIVMLFI